MQQQGTECLPPEIVYEVYRFRFTLLQQELHKEIKEKVEDAHERLKYHTTRLFNHGRKGWHSLSDFLQNQLVNWGLWHLLIGTAASATAHYEDLGTTGVILKNSSYRTGRYLVKSEACVMEAYPRVVIYRSNNSYKMIRRKRLGFF